jgi:protease-4
MERPLNPGERALLQMRINQGYDLFLTRCAEGRHMSKQDVDKIAQGRVWTGAHAKELGLVDELGSIDKALEIAARKAEVESYTVMAYPEKKDFLLSLLESKPDNYVRARLLKGMLGNYYKEFSLLRHIDKNDFIQARLPMEVNVE